MQCVCLPSFVLRWLQQTIGEICDLLDFTRRENVNGWLKEAFIVKVADLLNASQTTVSTLMIAYAEQSKTLSKQKVEQIQSQLTETEKVTSQPKTMAVKVTVELKTLSDKNYSAGKILCNGSQSWAAKKVMPMIISHGRLMIERMWEVWFNESSCNRLDLCMQTLKSSLRYGQLAHYGQASIRQEVPLWVECEVVSRFNPLLTFPPNIAISQDDDWP